MSLVIGTLHGEEHIVCPDCPFTQSVNPKHLIVNPSLNCTEVVEEPDPAPGLYPEPEDGPDIV